jgi:hypothetical protein
VLGLSRHGTRLQILISERTVIAMRFAKGLVGGLALAGLVGCSGGASGSPSVNPVPAVRTTASSVPSASPQVKAGARAAAAQFYALYSANRFAAIWNLLSPATKRHVSQRVWVSVHDACRDAGAGKSRIIESGGAAIITETITRATSKPGTAEDVFGYANGHWRYSPGDPSIYYHGSVAADIAAAKAAGFCVGWRIF